MPGVPHHHYLAGWRGGEASLDNDFRTYAKWKIIADLAGKELKRIYQPDEAPIGDINDEELDF